MRGKLETRSKGQLRKYVRKLEEQLRYLANLKYRQNETIRELEKQLDEIQLAKYSGRY